MKNVFIIVICALYFLNSNHLQAQETMSDIQNVFRHYKELNSRFLKSQEKQDRDALEEYAEKELYLALKIFEANICSEFDSALFANFIKLLLSNKNSADEIPVNTLGAIFICQTSKTESFIKMMGKEERGSVLSLLEFGFLNEINDKNKDYEKKKKVLETLKKY